MVADGGTLSDSEQVALADQLKKTFTPQITGATKDGVREMVRAMLPEMAEKIVREEIQRIHEEERSVEIDESRLSAAIHEAFAPQVEYMAREMVRELVGDMLPKMTEKMVADEIERIKTDSV